MITTMPTASRRAFLGAAGGAVLLAACGGEGDSRGVGGRPDERDVGVLNSVLALENAVIAAYTDGVDLLRGRSARHMRTILGHEREHAAALARAVVELGGTPARPKTAEEYRRGFPRLRGPRDVLVFAVDLEELTVKRHTDAVARLTRGNLRQTVGAIATNEAEHLSVVLGELGRPRVPEAFVTGKS